LDDFVCSKINLSNFSFLSTFYGNVTYNDTHDAQFLTELVGVRDREYQVVFNDNSNLSPSELGSNLLSVASSRFLAKRDYVMAWQIRLSVCFPFVYRLSVVFDVRASYSEGLTFRGYFCTIL